MNHRNSTGKNEADFEESLRDTEGLAAAQSWWNSNVDDHAEALAAIRQLKTAQTKAANAKAEKAERFGIMELLHRLWVPIGALAAIAVLAIFTFDFGSQRQQLATLPNLQLAALAQNPPVAATRGILPEPLTPATWLDPNAQIVFGPRDAVTLVVSSQKIPGRWSQSSSAGSTRFDFAFDPVVIEATRYQLGARLDLPFEIEKRPSQHLSLDGARLQFTFVAPDGTKSEIERAVSPVIP